MLAIILPLLLKFVILASKKWDITTAISSSSTAVSSSPTTASPSSTAILSSSTTASPSSTAMLSSPTATTLSTTAATIIQQSDKLYINTS
ncbi:unnamed protein product [Rotaria sp. Silwood1]|nr:unnamed protein product [Rotaria sp. Silwood1]CAF4982405.1 unnamed protein product [Rotaria sp. Silwood1]